MTENNSGTARAARKKQAIMDAAWKVFADKGYERTTVEAIVAVCGGSKATVYSYFKSKQDLFLQASFERAKELSAHSFLDFPAYPSLRESLLAFGLSYLRFYLNSDLIEIFRLAASEGKKLPFGTMLYEKCFTTSWGKVAVYLEEQIRPERLFPGKGWTAAMHLRGLLDGDTLLKHSWAVEEDLSPEEAQRLTDAAVTAFLRIYAPEELPGETRLKA